MPVGHGRLPVGPGREVLGRDGGHGAGQRTSLLHLVYKFDDSKEQFLCPSTAALLDEVKLKITSSAAADWLPPPDVDDIFPRRRDYVIALACAPSASTSTSSTHT